MRSLGLPILCIAALSAASLAASPTSAQDETGGHPAHIHLGTCSELGEIAWPLSNVGPGTVRNGVPSTNGVVVGQTSDIYPVDVSVTTLDVPLTEITGGTHAINVHKSAANIQNYIACGNIGGTQYGNTLIIGLGQLNDTGYTGIAVLRADGDQTVVTVYLEGADAVTLEEATPANEEPTPEDTGEEPAAPAEAAVSIAGFAFDSPSLEVPAGTTVTWTNNDGASHTVTADDGSFDSGSIAGGGTYSFTFDTPGTYAYHCDFHQNMTATVIVT
jgi:plastocyanin